MEDYSTGYPEAIETEKARLKSVVDDYTNKSLQLKVQKEAYQKTYHTQLLFVAATLSAILIGSLHQNDLPLISKGSILVAKVGLLSCSLFVVVLLNLQLSAFRKYDNEVLQHYQNRLIKPASLLNEERLIVLKVPRSVLFFEFLTSFLFIVSMISLIVYCISVAWPKIGPYFNL